jgi:hypothetical protein
METQIYPLRGRAHTRPCPVQRGRKSGYAPVGMTTCFENSVLRMTMKKAKRYRHGDDFTPMAVTIATICGAAALYCSEIIYGNIKDSDAPMRQLPDWRAHMASACIGALVFVTSLFLLEKLGGRSRSRALRSAVPWLPMVGLTGLATAIHIPISLVILIVAFYSPWAYLRMRAIR